MSPILYGADTLLYDPLALCDCVREKGTFVYQVVVFAFLAGQLFPLPLAADLHYEVDLSCFLSKRSKIMYFRPEFDPFTRLGLRAKTGLFPTFPETPSPSKLKIKLKNSGLPQVPRKYYNRKM